MVSGIRWGPPVLHCARAQNRILQRRQVSAARLGRNIVGLAQSTHAVIQALAARNALHTVRSAQVQCPAIFFWSVGSLGNFVRPKRHVASAKSDLPIFWY